MLTAMINTKHLGMLDKSHFLRFLDTENTSAFQLYLMVISAIKILVGLTKAVSKKLLTDSKPLGGLALDLFQPLGGLYVKSASSIWACSTRT